MASSAEHFSCNLRRLREERKHQEGGWGQADLGDRIGVHQNYIGMLERNERKPPLDTLDDIAAELGVEAHELIMPPEESAGSYLAGRSGSLTLQAGEEDPLAGST